MAFFNTLRSIALLFGLVGVTSACGSIELSGQPPLPMISTTNVHRVDVVAAKGGNPALGSIEFALRTGEEVHYFLSAENCGLYEAQPELYPNVGVSKRLALMGADSVELFQKGVHDPALGKLVVGNPDKYTADYKGATFAFASEDNRALFAKSPEKYIPEVGGYCLGAMSQHRITPGDPRNTYFLPEEKKWAVFGSPNGPIIWAAMTTQEREESLGRAREYYHVRTNHSNQER